MKHTERFGSKKLWLPLILSISLIAASCASTGRQEKNLEESLKASVELFNSAFRWEDYAQASAFVPAAKKEAFWAEVDRFKGRVRLTEYEVREIDIREQRFYGTAILRFQYWRLESPTLENVTFTQKWYFSEKDKLWKVIESGFEAIPGR